MTPEDLEIWQRVAASTRAAHKPPPRRAEDKPPAAPPPEPTPPDRFRPPRFRVGQSATAMTPRFDPAPSPAQRLAATPPGMDAKLHRRMSRGKLAPEARIDLHGLTLNAAQPVLERFILRTHASGLRLVLVITGKGKAGGPDAPLPVRPGALRHNVPMWLHRPPLSRLVLQVTPAHHRHGGEGAYYVYLRK
nr:Smr/MutS family protein [Paracoccus sp. S-4012]